MIRVKWNKYKFFVPGLGGMRTEQYFHGVPDTGATPELVRESWTNPS